MPEIRKQIANLDDRYAAAGELLPDDVARLMDVRMAALRGYARAYDDMVGDHVRPEYVDSFLKHLAQMRDAGVVDKLATKLTAQGVTMYDEEGRAFDRMRGTDSVLSAFEQYVAGEGGSYRHIKNWAREQGGSSWSNRSVSLKRWVATRRDVPLDSYYWAHHSDYGRSIYEHGIRLQGGDAPLDTTYTAWHALNYHLVSTVEMPNRDAARGVITLMRSKDVEVMRLHGMKPGDARVMTRGALESTSLVQKVTVYGTELTIQDVPYHRIFGSYFWSRTPGGSECLFLGDNENEFVAMLEGLEAMYNAPTRRGR